MTQKEIDLTAHQIFKYFATKENEKKVEWEIISDLKRILNNFNPLPRKVIDHQDFREY